MKQSPEPGVFYVSPRKCPACDARPEPGPTAVLAPALRSGGRTLGLYVCGCGASFRLHVTDLAGRLRGTPAPLTIRLPEARRQATARRAPATVPASEYLRGLMRRRFA